MCTNDLSLCVLGLVVDKEPHAGQIEGLISEAFPRFNMAFGVQVTKPPLEKKSVRPACLDTAILTPLKCSCATRAEERVIEPL